MKERISTRIRDFFLGSSDFNGILVAKLCEEFDLDWSEIQPHVTALLSEEAISLTFGSHSLNPHIKRLPDLPVDEQLERLATEDPLACCAYPSSREIRAASDLSSYDSRLFTKRLALAEPQLMPVFFDLDILDRYYRDPRYHFDFQDYGGSIGIAAEHSDSTDFAEQDKILLQSFGIAYDSSRHRVVVVFLRYLSDLSPEHQQIWNAYVVTQACSMNSDYRRAVLFGHWHEYYSAYQAFLTEQAEINKLTKLIGKPDLFNQTFDEHRPQGFHPMIRPTRQSFDEFIHLLDKLLSENINRDFFRSDIPLEREITRDDGAVEIQRLGTIQLLESWLSTRYRTSEGEDVSHEVVAPLKEVRKLRQKPAHVLRTNEYDQSYPGLQDKLVGEACRALTKLRVILWSHPRAGDRYTPPAWLDGDKIVFY